MQNQIEQQRIDAQKNYQKLESDIRLFRAIGITISDPTLICLFL